ncbi:alpha/beta fold hydrolase [Lentisalinibacter salinarum]|uniref:alpha/beta fold hydrolase n=1 Tax=Lentisalinibacter salinarum TaxID=2992239 RepID=UPI00386901F6
MTDHSHYSDEYFESEDGLRLHYRDYRPQGGDDGRPPVFCLPGLTRNSRDFETIADHLSHDLSPGRRVISPDFRGRGLSDYDREWRNYHPLTYVRDVEKLVAELGLERIVCLGTSLGGLVSMALNHRQPKLVDRVILNDVGPEIAPEGLARIMGYAGRTPDIRSWEDAVALSKANYGVAYPDLSDEEWLAYARTGYREDEHGVPRLDCDPKIGDALREVGGELEDPWVLFAGLAETPTLLIHGVLSDILTDEIVAKMRAAKPDLEVVPVPNRGHAPMLNEPASIAGIDAFLA